MTGEWHIGAVDLTAYLRRVGRPEENPSAAALTALARAHVETIPFENVDVVLKRHRGIGLDVVSEKLVGRRRGGYCYEQAGLFAAVAERLGYEVQRTAARVQPRRGGPYTHMTLIVTVDGAKHLVDVGFGAGILVPMPLADGAVVDQAGWPHRLVERDGWWILQKRTDDGWDDLHEFLPKVHSEPLDYEVFHHYTSTHPNSPFTGRLVIMRLEPGRFRRLLGRELTEERPDGSGETRTIEPQDLEKTLQDLDIELVRDELEALLEVY
ncbi:arylamine N-acetyltransferase [Amycolatopsis sp. FDAARGOS 1241]|uniref:arylamine N-acetyltransferase family protein n=1 Tax=Amycolatopsis sp. FDAARGOS 1241 TaxID=2778070 RepID=UPI0019510D3D|nr:arylamine N-acetyltransferase [Amycolatopsis sp. FDAARGOS 1241]QRP45606.1 arylamine N-acetyltransferase [Amycolatopsis sp. FDAARGOS 1241]